MDREGAQHWLDRYVATWLGEGEVSDAASARDVPDTYDARYAPVAVDGDTVVATGRSTYRETPQGPVTEFFHNCFVIRFGPDGRCREFTEYYLKQPNRLVAEENPT